MSLTYPDPIRPEPQPTVPEMIAREAGTTAPVYARAPVRRGKVRSWMILAPVGVLTVAAIGAWTLMTPGEDVAVPAEPASLISAPAASADTAAPVEGDTLETGLATDGLAGGDAAPAAVTAAPAAAAPAPAPRAAPAPAPAARQTQPEPAARPVETVSLPDGPQAYEAVVAADGGATAPTEAAEPAPLIVVEPN